MLDLIRHKYMIHLAIIAAFVVLTIMSRSNWQLLLRAIGGQSELKSDNVETLDAAHMDGMQSAYYTIRFAVGDLKSNNYGPTVQACVAKLRYFFWGRVILAGLFVVA